MIDIKGLTKVFTSSKQRVVALDNLELKIEKGEFVLIKGHSGCGKSTFLFTIGGLLKPSAGSVRVDGKELYSMSREELLRYKALKTGFVFQSYYLLPYLTVYDNIAISNKIKGINITKETVFKIAERLKIDHRLNHKPSELSVGEKQRVSLARAMVTNPGLILADEPTGNLDPENAQQVLGFLEEFKTNGGTVVMVTHGTDADKHADREIYMNNGSLM